MEWLNDLARAAYANFGAVLGFAGLIVTGYWALRKQKSGDSVEAAKVAVELRKVHNLEREHDDEVRDRQQATFERFLERLEKEREEARREREEARRENLDLRTKIGEQTGHLQALTERTVEQGREIKTLRDTVDQLKERVSQLIGFIRLEGKEPPPPPGFFPP